MRDPHTHELFAERPVRSDFGRSRSKTKLRPLLVGGAVVAVLGGGVLWWNSGSDAPTEIPTITAEGPVKQRPEQPGGIDIPHQKETVFQQLDGSVTPKQPAVEHLLPSPEAPQTTAVQVPSEGPTPTAIEKPAAVQPTPAPVAAAPTQPVIPVESPAPQAAKPAPVATTVQPEAPKPQPLNSAPAQQPTASKSAKPLIVGHLPEDLFKEKSTPAKGFLVQLASFPDQRTAEAEMQKMQAKHAAALGDLRLRLVRADLGAKGTYYRVQTPSLTDAQARNICTTLLEKRANCMIVRP